MPHPGDERPADPARTAGRLRSIARRGSALSGAALLTWAVLLTRAATAPLSGQSRVEIRPSATRPPSDGRISGFRDDLSALRERLGIPGLSVAVARNGELLWSAGLGWADVDSRRPATPDTPYRIASIAKTMTAVVIVELAEEGRLELDAPLGMVVEAGPPWSDSVTVRHVLSHTSGSRPPGSSFAYSGRYDLLARAATAAGRRPFAEQLARRVLRPAGMAHSYPVSLQDAPLAEGIRGRLATPYLPDGRPAPSDALPDRTSGGNGVVSTVLDLVRWVDALERSRVASERIREELWTPTVTPAGDTLPYGLGWWVERTPTLDIVHHGGQWPVYSGLLLHVRRPDLTLAILANHTGVSRPFYGIGTGTPLLSTFAASFLRHFALDDVWQGPVPTLPWEASADSLSRLVDARRSPTARHHLGSELFGRGLVARAAGRPARGDSLLRAAVACCPSAVEGIEDLGLLFHLGRSDDPRLRGLGQRAGLRRLERLPGDPTTTFNLAVSYVRSGEDDRALPLLRRLVERRGDVPTWMWSWSAYLLAEQIAGESPGRARALLERVLAEGTDDSGLFGEVRGLLRELEPRTRR